ncbi:Ger(x)C family spore germination protein [Bacillus sp. CECT 9360]|uniref:Ger(x)C family spore germination protein n=1 Tax=Bacillus sp. CECT 9360 TaxID=2845821 RepID=UPI001E5ADE51|nr:Ger(x)C family spore germination protein [Bacillus sp. CECT 9360]CAH0347246.1 hypothetical protein BCI9360_03637 [Bacillus sp. CECT 9360]
MIRRCVIMCCLAVLCLSGCANYKELNKTALIIGMGIDYNKGKKRYDVSFQVINPNEKSKSPTAGRALPVVSYHATGKTISEAARKSTQHFSRQNDYSHIMILIIDEDLARKESLNYFLDVFERDAKIRSSIPVVISKGAKAREVLNILPSIEDPSMSIASKVENSSKLLGENTEIKIYEVIEALSSKGAEPAISGIEIHGSKQTGLSRKNYEKVNYTHTYLNGIGMFRKGKLVGWLEGQDTKSYQIVKNKLKTTNLSVACDRNRYTSIRVKQSNSKSKVTIKQGRASINIAIKANGMIDESLCNKDISSQKVIQDFEKKAAQEYSKIIRGGISKAKKHQSDIFGFGEMLRRSDHDVWKQHENEWGEIFSKAEVKVNVSFKIQGTSMRTKAYPFR